MYDKPHNITQLAKQLNIPQSTCTVNVQILERAGLIQTEQTGQKICSTSYEEVVIPLLADDQAPESAVIEMDMPIGLYSDCDVHPPCGLLSEHKVIGYFDVPECFLDPQRGSAQLLWLTDGWLEYRFPKYHPPAKKITAVSFTAELCSEYPTHNLNWPSDITVWIDGHEIGTWTSPGDMGGARGRLTPEWWTISNTQYGFRKTWRVCAQGSYIDGIRVSAFSIQDLALDTTSPFVVRIGIKPNAQNRGGLNMFGRKFGNYEHDILLLIELEDTKPSVKSQQQ